MSFSTPPIAHQKVRSRPTAGVLQSDSPRTPQSRSVSGIYGSPGSSFRIDDENLLIFEFGTRLLRAGFAGESSPRCKIDYCPDLWRRVGDYRPYELGYTEPRSARRAHWARSYELWDLDLRDADLGLIEDRVEKLTREAESKYLLLDNRARRVALTAPSNLPRPLLNVLLRQLFEGLQATSVTILPTSIMTCVSAGVRSALVVDMGWRETVVTAVHEYREVKQSTSVRAGKRLCREVKRVLLSGRTSSANDDFDITRIEEIIRRAVWCRIDATKSGDSEQQQTIHIAPCESAPLGAKDFEVSLEQLSASVDTALLVSDADRRDLDDHDLSIPQSIYDTLLQVPVDIRNQCLSHMIFTGGISSIPGLKTQILQKLRHQIALRAWDPVRTYTAHTKGAPPVAQKTRHTQEIQPSHFPYPQEMTKVTESTAGPPDDEPQITTIPAHNKPHDTNAIDMKLASLAVRDAAPSLPNGQIRAVDSLGPWAGASLVTSLRIRGAVEIERERFLSHGLAAGSISIAKPGAGVAPETYGRSRQSLGPNSKLGGEKNSGWSLGIWA